MGWRSKVLLVHVLDRRLLFELGDLRVLGPELPGDVSAPLLKGLLEGGVKFGVSTRGLGSISERAGTRYVCSDYVITAIDAVTDPSSINAFVDAVNESQEWLITDDGRIVESIKKEIKKNKLNEERKLQLIQNFLLSIRG